MIFDWSSFFIYTIEISFLFLIYFLQPFSILFRFYILFSSSVSTTTRVMETSLAEEGMAGNTKSGGQEPIYFGSLHGMFGGFRLAPRFVTRQRLEALFQTQGGVILLDTEAQEIMPDPASGGQLYPQLRPGGVYLVTDEQQLEAIDRTDDDRVRVMSSVFFASDQGSTMNVGTDDCPGMRTGSSLHSGDHERALVRDAEGTDGAHQRALPAAASPSAHVHGGEAFGFSREKAPVDVTAVDTPMLTVRLVQDHLVHGFVKAVKEGPLAIRAFLKKETETGIYSLDVFTTKFCECDGHTVFAPLLAFF